MFLVIPFALVLSLSVGVTVNATTSSFDEKNSIKAAEQEKYKKELSNLTKEEIRSYFMKIDEDYDVGEPFSLKEQTFIEMYAKPVNPGEINLSKSLRINESKTVAGITVRVNGVIYDDIQNLIN